MANTMSPERSSKTLDRAAEQSAAARLRDVPLFEAAPPQALDALARTASVETVQAGEWLFRSGDPAEAAYVVTSGRLRVVDDRDGGDATIRIVGPGALLGELGVLTGTSRSASVQATRDSQVIALDGGRLAELVSSDAGFASALALQFARQLQQSGGLLPAAAPAAVYTVVGVGSSAAIVPFVRQLTEELSSLAETVVFDGSEASDAVERAALVGAAEAKASCVLLLAHDRAGDDSWRDFALRQSDRVVVVTDGAPPEDGERLRGADVAFVANPSSSAIAWWLDAVVPGVHHIVPDGDRAAVARVARRLTGRSLGVVLSGGGARGLAHIGVVGALRDAGFEIDRVGGCSIGAFIGAMAAFGWAADHMADVCERELVRRSPFSDYTIPRVSLIRAKRAAAMLERIFGSTLIEEIERPLFTVSADLMASRLHVHRRGPVYEAVGASMSIPGLVPPVPFGTQLLVDGGVLNNLPVDLMDSSEGPIVAVDVIRRMESRGEPREPALPTIMETLSRATVLGSVERSERNRRLATVTIAPDVQAIGLREFGALRRAIDAGRRVTEQALANGALDELRRTLGAGAPSTAL